MVFTRVDLGKPQLHRGQRVDNERGAAWSVRAAARLDLLDRFGRATTREARRASGLPRKAGGRCTMRR